MYSYFYATVTTTITTTNFKPNKASPLKGNPPTTNALDERE